MLTLSKLFFLIVSVSLTPLHAYIHYEFTGKGNVNIVYTKYGDQKGQYGSIVISPGRTESSLKHEELSNELIEKGFSPVFIINHRGQGLSGRVLEDTNKGHVAKFSYYYKDFEKFVKSVLRDSQTDKNNLFLLAHSMGGAIATGYLQTYGTDLFKGLVLSSPMLGINFNDKTEFEVLMETLIACKTPLGPDCNDYAQEGKYSPEADLFEGNDNTSSRDRFERRKRLWMDIPKLQLGGPSIRWVKEAIKANLKMRRHKAIKKITDLPVLLLQAEKDVTVSNEKQSKFCSTVNKVDGNCTLKVIKNSKHEILMEADHIRDIGVRHILDFIEH